MSQLDRAIAAHRANIRSIDRSTLGTIEAGYQAMLTRLDPLIEMTIQQAAADGVTTPAELFRIERYRELQRQTAVELERLAVLTGNTTAQAQAQAAQVAIADAQALTLASSPDAATTQQLARDWTHINTSAVEDVFGATQSGPVADLLRTFGDDGMRFIADQLVQGFAAGESPRKMARRIESGLEISRNRALTIARTETLRAARGATQTAYAANSDVLNGWYWTAAHSARTCAACLALDGSLHPLDEPLRGHPNCRCAMRPALKNPRARTIETGEEWLATQPVDVQDAILGKSGGAAYRSGEVALQDFVRRDESAIWGTSYRDGGVGWARMKASRRVVSDPVDQLRKRGVTPYNGMPQYEIGSSAPISPIGKWSVDPDTYREASGHMVKALDKIKQRFDITPDTNLRVINPITNEIEAIAAQKTFVVHGNDKNPNHATHVGDRINYNAAYWTDGKENNLGFFRSSAASSEAAGKPRNTPHSISQSEADVLVHEFGHSIHNAGIVMAPRAYDDFVSAWRTMKESDYWVSQYAVTNKSEGFSEAFAAMVTGNRDVPPEMARAIDEIIDEIKKANADGRRKRAA